MNLKGILWKDGEGSYSISNEFHLTHATLMVGVSVHKK